MAGLIGYALGTALNWNKQQNQQQQLGREKMADMTLQMAMSGHPEVLQTPEAQKIVGNVYGKDMLGVVQNFAQGQQKTQQQFQKDLGGPSSSQPPPSGMPTAAGMSSGSMIMGTGAQPTPAQGAPAQAPTAAPAPAPANFDNPKTLDDWQAKESYLSDLAGDPRYADDKHQAIIKQHLDIASRNVTEMRALQQHDREFQQSQAGLEEQRKQGDAFRQQSLALQTQGLSQNAANQALSQQIRQESVDSSNQIKTMMANMTASRDKEAQQNHFTQGVAGIQKQVENVTKLMATDLNSAKALLPGLNANLKTMKKHADSVGIEYDPELLKPLTIKSAPTWLASHGIGSGTTSSLAPTEVPAAAAPTGAMDGTAPVIRKDTAGKVWKLNSAGTGWEPAE